MAILKHMDFITHYVGLPLFTQQYTIIYLLAV